MMEGYAPSLEGYYYCHCGLLLPKMPRNPDRGADFIADGTSDRNADGTSYRNADGNADGNATNIPMTGKPMQLGQTALPSNIPTTGKPTRTGRPTRTRKPTITRRPAITRRPTRRPTICISSKSSKNSKGAKGSSLCSGAKASVSGFSNPLPTLDLLCFRRKEKTRFRHIVFSSFHDTCHTPSSLPRSIIPPYPLPAFFKRKIMTHAQKNEKIDKKKENNIATGLFDRT